MLPGMAMLSFCCAAPLMFGSTVKQVRSAMQPEVCHAMCQMSAKAARMQDDDDCATF